MYNSLEAKKNGTTIYMNTMDINDIINDIINTFYY